MFVPSFYQFLARAIIACNQKLFDNFIGVDRNDDVALYLAPVGKAQQHVHSAAGPTGLYGLLILDRFHNQLLKKEKRKKKVSFSQGLL